MRRQHVGAADGAHATVGGKHHNGGQRRFQCAVQVREALNVQHVHFVDEEDARHQLRDALVNVPVHDLVDFLAQLFRDFRLLGLHQLPHDAHNVPAALGAGVGHVQIVQRHVLDDFLLFVHVALGQRHVLLGFQVKLRRVVVAAADAFDGARRGFNVNDVADLHLFLLQAFVNGRVQLEVFHALHRLQPHHDVGHGLAVAAQRVFRLLRHQLRHFPFVHLLGFLDAQPDRPPEVLHQDFCLFHFRRKHFRPHHGAEGDLRNRQAGGKRESGRKGEGTNDRRTDGGEQTEREIEGERDRERETERETQTQRHTDTPWDPALAPTPVQGRFCRCRAAPP